MEAFWSIVRGWNPLGQWLFFLLIFIMVVGGFLRLGYYITVWLRGWPPAHVTEADRKQE